MKTRITCNKTHPLGKLFKDWNNVDYFSRSSGFDLHNINDVNDFLSQTENYDLTINFSRGIQFGSVKLLCGLDAYCYNQRLNHKVLNIGSYVSLALLNNPCSTYDVEKASLKFAHRKISYTHIYHKGYLDSYLISLSHMEEISIDIKNEYTHLSLLKLEDVVKNINFMLKYKNIKELSLQYQQPGNHRINNGIGPIFPGLY